MLTGSHLVTFIDETTEIQRIYNSNPSDSAESADFEDSQDFRPLSPTISEPSHEGLGAFNVEPAMLFSPRFQTPQQEIYFQPSPFQIHPDPSSPPSIAISHQCSPPDTPETSRPAISPTSRVAPARHSLDRESLLNATSIYESQSIWNLSSAEQVCLMRHFIEDLSLWFDICDPRRHFATIIPQRAASSSLLRKAVFATSARHLSRSGRFDSGSADRYYQDCLDDLIPAVHDHDTITDETLLVAAVVLRLLEELDCNLTILSGRIMLDHY
jgi:hypothetical protein